MVFMEPPLPVPAHGAVDAPLRPIQTHRNPTPGKPSHFPVALLRRRAHLALAPSRADLAPPQTPRRPAIFPSRCLQAAPIPRCLEAAPISRRLDAAPPLRRLDPASPLRCPEPASPYVVDHASAAPLKMPHSEDYKIPHGFSICHTRELEGKVITYWDGDVVDLQEDLIQSYNHLAATFNKYRVVDCWLNGVGERANTDLMEERLGNLRRDLRNDRNETVSLMTQIMKAGAEPLPPDAALDADVAAALDTTVLLRDAAITAGGGQQAVSEFRVHAIQSMDEAIINSWPSLIEKVEEHLREHQARVQQRAAQARARANDEANAEATVYAQGPSAGVVHRRKEAELRSQEARQDEMLRRQNALDKLKADRQRRCAASKMLNDAAKAQLRL